MTDLPHPDQMLVIYLQIGVSRLGDLIRPIGPRSPVTLVRAPDTENVPGLFWNPIEVRMAHPGGNAPRIHALLFYGPGQGAPLLGEALIRPLDDGTGSDLIFPVHELSIEFEMEGQIYA